MDWELTLVHDPVVYPATVPPRPSWVLLALLSACGPGWTRNVDIEPPVIRREGGAPVTKTTRSVEESSSSQCSASASCRDGRTLRCAGTSRCWADDNRGVTCERVAGPSTSFCVRGVRVREVSGAAGRRGRC